jgi:hypothetical protein
VDSEAKARARSCRRRPIETHEIPGLEALGTLLVSLRRQAGMSSRALAAGSTISQRHLARIQADVVSEFQDRVDRRRQRRLDRAAAIAATVHRRIMAFRERFPDIVEELERSHPPTEILTSFYLFNALFLVKAHGRRSPGARRLRLTPQGSLGEGTARLMISQRV